MDKLSSLGCELARLRQSQGMTQEALAASSGIGLSTIAGFETGGLAELGSGELLRLLDALGHELSFSPRQRVSAAGESMARQQRAFDASAGSGED